MFVFFTWETRLKYFFRVAKCIGWQCQFRDTSGIGLLVFEGGGGYTSLMGLLAFVDLCAFD